MMVKNLFIILIIIFITYVLEQEKDEIEAKNTESRNETIFLNDITTNVMNNDGILSLNPMDYLLYNICFRKGCV